MMSVELRSTEAHRDTGERTPLDSIKLSVVLEEVELSHEARQNRHLLVERIRQSIAAGDYLTFEKIDGTVKRLHRKLIGP